MSALLKKAARMAARMYLNEDDERKGYSAKQCFAAAAKKHEVSYESLCAYVNGAGLRAIYGQDEESNLELICEQADRVFNSAVGERQTAGAFFGEPEWYEVDGEELERLERLCNSAKQAVQS